jgi:hypothetical protein
VTPRPSTLLRRAALVFGGWTLYAFMAASVLHAWRSGTGEPTPPYSGLLRFWLVTAWLWAALTFPIIAASRRLPITAATWPVRVPLHLVFALVAHAVHEALLWAMHPLIRPGPRPDMAAILMGTLFIDLFVYVALVAIVHAADAQRHAVRLRAELLEAELHVLRMQLQPHFLFNTLNGVSELIHIDPLRAERALVRLGDLLRWSLQTARLQEVSVRDELAALEHYLDIQRLRHGEALTFRIEADADTLDLATPSLLLQPLVENAIRHGVRGRSSGTISIRAWREGGHLRLLIRDDGRGIVEPYREGTGLRTTRTRLSGLYGRSQELIVTNGPEGGASIGIRVPAHGAPAAWWRA